MAGKLTTEQAQALAAQRLNPSGGRNGGRPRSRKKRCYCGASTFNRAKARAFDCCKKAGSYDAT